MEAEENKEDEEEVPNLMNLEAKFVVKHNELRFLINDIAKPRLHKIFRDRAKLLCGSKYTHCDTLSDWLQEYKHGPYDNKKQWMVNCLINECGLGRVCPWWKKSPWRRVVWITLSSSSAKKKGNKGDS
jgi:hypothetical protein